MKPRKPVVMLLAALMSVSVFATSALAAATDKKATDWREDYAYHLGVQAYVFSFPWIYLSELRYLWVGKPKPPGYTDFDMAFNHFYHSREIITPAYQSGGSPNNDTLYSMTFAPGNLPKVDAFWSITLYDSKHNLVSNPVNRYAISSNSGGYKKAKDGSLTLYIQNTSPGKDKESNWLPTPQGEFLLAFRTYLPGKEIVEQTWQIPGLVKVK